MRIAFVAENYGGHPHFGGVSFTNIKQLLQETQNFKQPKTLLAPAGSLGIQTSPPSENAV
ncbi:hypothetical protein [Scytonema sp. HK-05]|uniref:hypothetical protein n=1 Tax=Scytonema sp. HK-05 TaxID=1137095 RepID=UPI0009373926|nr:hypothetical protein [Scytonema sp. HK-05]